MLIFVHAQGRVLETLVQDVCVQQGHQVKAFRAREGMLLAIRGDFSPDVVFLETLCLGSFETELFKTLNTDTEVVLAVQAGYEKERLRS